MRRIYIELAEEGDWRGLSRCSDEGQLPMLVISGEQTMEQCRRLGDEGVDSPAFGVAVHDPGGIDRDTAAALAGQGMQVLEWVVVGSKQQMDSSPAGPGAFQDSLHSLAAMQRLFSGLQRKYPAVAVEARVALSFRSLQVPEQFLQTVLEASLAVDLLRLQLWPVRGKHRIKVPKPVELKQLFRDLGTETADAYAQGRASIGVDCESGIPLCFFAPDNAWLVRPRGTGLHTAIKSGDPQCQRCVMSPWCTFAGNATLNQRYALAFNPHIAPFSSLPDTWSALTTGETSTAGRRLLHVRKGDMMDLPEFHRLGADAHLWGRPLPARVRVAAGTVAQVELPGGWGVTLVRLPAIASDDRLAVSMLPPLSLLQLAGTLEEAGVEMAVHDLGALSVSKAASRLGQLSLRGMLGISVESPEMIRQLDAVLASVPDDVAVVAGGRGITDGTALLRLSRRVDFVVEGEGDYGLLELARALSASRPVRAIPGLVWRTGNQVVRCPSAHHDLDLPGYSDGKWVDDTLYTDSKFPFKGERVLPAMFVHGCPFHCAFCGDYSGGIIRTRDPGKVAAQIQRATRATGISNFLFLNTLVNASPRYLAQLLEQFEQMEPAVRWADSAKPRGLSKAVLERMQQAGCVALTWGIDAGSRRLASMVNKSYDPDEASRILQWSAEAGIANVVNLIAGLPHETKSDVDEARQWLRDHRRWVGHVNIMKFLFLPNSPMYQRPGQFGLTVRPDGIGFDEADGLDWESKQVQIVASWRLLLEVAGEMGYGFVTGSGSELSNCCGPPVPR